MSDQSRKPEERSADAGKNGPQQAGGATYTNQHRGEQQGIVGPGAGDGAGEPGAEKGRDQKAAGKHAG
jgi:hypothetical protein